jgi:dipeptidyl aminopeptidase/acylaminoacyl peptidase
MMTSGPVGFTRDATTLYLMDSRGIDTGALFACDAADVARREKIASNPKADVGETIVDPATGRVQAVGFEYARREWQILDPSIKPDLDYLRTVEDGELDITSRSRTDMLWTVAFTIDTGPARFYLYDRAAKRAKFLFTNRSELDGRTLAKMKPVIIKSRDGLDLVSYLTVPVSGPSKNLPMVLFVHGGPWGRDSWGYHSYHQWLANRGYAVLSVNFRGSTGFGKSFINAANREWSGTMHNDLIDAVNWAVKEGVADPKKVAIMGGSYGGYATLVGLTFTPETFACGVDIVGPSHIRTLLETIPPYWEPMKVMFETRVGRLSEPEFLDSISPLTRADRIVRPLLIAQGKNDPRVKEAESRQIVEAMQKNRIPVTYVVFPDEGHGFAEPANSMAFTAISESFLSRHLGGRCEPIESDVRQSSAQIEAGAELVPGLSTAAP